MSTTPIGVSASKNRRGVTARKTTGVANSERSRFASWAARAWAIRAPRVLVPCSVAEGVGCFIADPLPHRDGPAELRVVEQVPLVEVSGVEADRTDQVAPTRVGVAPDEVFQRGTALAGRA